MVVIPGPERSDGARDPSPWAIETGGVRVEPGDLVIADETRVCFVPRDRMTDVLTLAQQKVEAEDIRCKAIDGGIAVPDISRATYGEKS